MDATTFRRISSYWATGVAVVTTLDAEGRYYGLTMSGLTSLSLDPPLFLICVDKRSDTLKPIQQSQAFCINILTMAQQELAQRFATKGLQKFSGIPSTPGQTGVPLIEGALASLECRVREEIEGGDHVVFFGELAQARLGNGAPLLFYHGSYKQLPSRE